MNYAENNSIAHAGHQEGGEEGRDGKHPKLESTSSPASRPPVDPMRGDPHAQ